MTPHNRCDCLAVIGTGFMGASVAAAAKLHKAADHVIGIDGRSAQEALSLGHIGAQAQSIAQLSQVCGQLAAGSKECSIAVVIASPVKTYAQVFSELAALSETLLPGQAIAWITDIGSTKAGVIKAAPSLDDLAPCFVSSHPMAGSEKQGPADARADLFQSARVLVSCLPQSTNNAVAEIEAFWIALGAQPSMLPIEDHDELLAAISHLPHVLAFSLAGALSGAPLAGAAQALHGGGLRDTTRIAGSSAELWADIFLDNRECLLAAWADWSLHLQVMHQALEKADRETLIALLTQASHWRKGFQ